MQIQMQCDATMIHFTARYKGEEDEEDDEDPRWGPVSERSIIERGLLVLLDRLESQAKKREKLIWGGGEERTGDMGSLKGRSCHYGIQASRNCTIDRLPVLKRCQPIGFNKNQTSTIIR
ncbi:hypothetical protein BHYA_0037g00400 [Botrytis hyacinthi]|uniref:Uncharacterized protein n=1 Tax=Botrytis hyacinthi TaxID=278943 RepID=A0A4Z1GZ04_9HELO|nr:hypothetical protein BHYA_0037g00400 [Botrytis hyacinthi]